MNYTYNDFIQYIPELKRYVRSKVKSDWWEDIVQETLTYLFIKFKTIVITNIRGILINTARFFIQKHYAEKRNVTFISNYDVFLLSINPAPQLMISEYNSCEISDNLYMNIKNVSKVLLIPFKMQMDNMSIKEIAYELNISETAVKTRLKRCKEYLKKTNEK